MKYLFSLTIFLALAVATPAFAQFASYEPEPLVTGNAGPGLNTDPAESNPMLETSNERVTTIERRQGVFSTRDLAFRRCTQAADCAVVTPRCSGPTAINRTFESGFSPAYNSAPATCAYVSQRVHYNADCIGGLCTVTSAATEPRRKPADPKFCYADSDCKVTVDACGKKSPVNNRFSATQAARVAAETECTSWTDNRPAAVRCQHNQCTVLFGRPPE